MRSNDQLIKNILVNVWTYENIWEGALLQTGFHDLKDIGGRSSNLIIKEETSFKNEDRMVGRFFKSKQEEFKSVDNPYGTYRNWTDYSEVHWVR